MSTPLYPPTSSTPAQERPAGGFRRGLDRAMKRSLIAGLIGLVLLVALFCTGLQSTLFGPVKYSVLPSVLRPEELTGGNGLVEMGTSMSWMTRSRTGLPRSRSIRATTPNRISSPTRRR